MEPSPPSARTLQSYSVETISRADSDALPIILRYEWLGNLGHATVFVGLVSPAFDRLKRDDVKEAA